MSTPLSDPLSARSRPQPARRPLPSLALRAALDKQGRPAAIGTRCLLHYDDAVRAAEARRERRLKVWTDDLGDVVGWPACEEDHARLAALVDLADSHPGLREVYLVIESFEPEGLLRARFEDSADLARCGLKAPPQPATADWARASGL